MTKHQIYHGTPYDFWATDISMPTFFTTSYEEAIIYANNDFGLSEEEINKRVLVFEYLNTDAIVIDAQGCYYDTIDESKDALIEAIKSRTGEHEFDLWYVLDYTEKHLPNISCIHVKNIRNAVSDEIMGDYFVIYNEQNLSFIKEIHI